MTERDDCYVAATALVALLGVSRATITRATNKALTAGTISPPVSYRKGHHYRVADVFTVFPEKAAAADWPSVRLVTPAQLATAPTLVYLTVPHAEKEQVKALGAKWDNSEKRWFAPRAHVDALTPWITEALPSTLPGEDRTFGGGLAFEPIPRSATRNVRTCVSELDWLRIVAMVRRRSNNTCELCGAGTVQADAATVDPVSLHTHERFSFDESTCVQRLERLVCACENCHGATHIGNSGARRGTTNDLERHFRSVTGVDVAGMQRLRAEADRLNYRRGTKRWSLDLEILEAVGLSTTAPPPAPAPLPLADETSSPDVDDQVANAASDDDESSFDPGELGGWAEQPGDLALILGQSPDGGDPSLEVDETPATPPVVDDVDEDSEPDPWDLAAPTPAKAQAAAEELHDAPQLTQTIAAVGLRPSMTGAQLRAELTWVTRPLRDRLPRLRRR